MSVSGAFFGMLLVTLVRQGLRQAELRLTMGGFEASGSAEIVVAVMMIAFLIWRANGVTGGGELSWMSLKRGLRIGSGKRDNIPKNKSRREGHEIAK